MSFYHTLPLAYLKAREHPNNVYIESGPCFALERYYIYTIDHVSAASTILDCGVGISPNLGSPVPYVPGDREWAAKYLRLALDIVPDKIVIPDILGNALGTEKNFQLYADVMENIRWSASEPRLIYVIQGENQKEAVTQVYSACDEDRADIIAFPRLVQYYGYDDRDCDGLATRRIRFIRSVLPQIDKPCHMLGLNSLRELRFAAEHGLSIDSRIAAMMGIAGLKISGYQRGLNRPPNLTIDLTVEKLPSPALDLIDYNVKLLDDLYEQFKA